MNATRIAYRNIRAEMARNGETLGSLAQKTGMSKDTLSRKLNGEAAFKLEEAVRLQQAAFPEQELSYLFAEIFAK